MRKKNNILKEYLSISEIFKWIVEGTLFNNNCIQTITINEEVDSLLTSSAFKVEKNRDIIRKVIVNGEALLIGIEHQSAVDYSMPVRNLVYDALTYEYQVKKKYAEQIAVGEKISPVQGMKKDTFLHRVETIVLYTGQKQWDGALSIRELLETDDLYFKNKEHFLSFKMNIIDACHMAEDEISQYKGDVYVLFKILNDKEHFISDENRKLRIKYKETLYVLAELRKDKRYIEIAEEGFDNDKEENNMCELLDLLENRGEVRGRAQGEKKGIQALIELCQELGLSKTETRIKTESKYNIEQSKLNDYIELYWK